MSSDRKKVPSELPPRAVGVRIGEQVFVPALPATAAIAAETRMSLLAHYGAVTLMDETYAASAALGAGRTVLYDPVADREAREEERLESRHRRTVAELRRDRERLEAELEVLRAHHRLAAEEEFKPLKFGLGHARYRARVAEAEVGEAVAREGMKPEILEPEVTSARSKAPSMAEQLARRIDDLEVQIEQREAAGQPTDELRDERRVLNKMLRAELLRGKP